MRIERPVVSRSLSMGVVFRGCVDREGAILSIDETSDTVGRAGMPVRNLIAPADRDAVDAVIRDREWSGITIRPVRLHTEATAVLVAAAVRRLVDVALIPVDAPGGIDAAVTALRTLLDGAEDGTWILDDGGGTLAASTRMTQLLGDPPQPGSLWDHFEDTAQIRAEYGTLWRHRARVRPDGAELELTGFPIADADGRLIGTLVRASVDPATFDGYARLVRSTLHDPLTGLPGRTHLLDRLTGATHERGIGMVALLRCAVDGFTIINESHGHQAGNAVLVQISDRLRELLGPDDYLARLGGDEFVLLCTGLGTAADAQPVAERLLGAFAEPFVLDTTALEVFASIGLVCYQPETSDLPGRTLLERADIAMRRAKSDSLGGGWAEYEEPAGR